MRYYSNYIGQVYGRLTIISVKAKSLGKTRCAFATCRCECGKIKEIRLNCLKTGNSKSCGCLQTDLMKKRMTTHGKSRTRLYKILYGMVSRCTNDKDHDYKNYGARGISICKEWTDKKTGLESFETWADNNGYKNNLQIDRIDNNGPYSPDNCRWVTQKENSRNSRPNRMITYNGETKTMAEWSEITGINYIALKNRISILKWDINRALETPLERRTKRVDYTIQ